MTEARALKPVETRKDRVKRQEVLDAGARIKIDGTWYEARLGDVTPKIARTLRKETGMSFMSLLSNLGEDPDVDLLQAFVWVARLIKGDEVELDSIDVGYAEMLDESFEVAATGAQEEDISDPEA